MKIAVFTFIALSVIDETVFDKVCGLTSWTVHRTLPIDLLFSWERIQYLLEEVKQKIWKSLLGDSRQICYH